MARADHSDEQLIAASTIHNIIGVAEIKSVNNRTSDSQILAHDLHVALHHTQHGPCINCGDMTIRYGENGHPFCINCR